MTSVVYEKIRAKRPELRLPSWAELRNTDRHKAKRLGVDGLIARRAAKIMRLEPGWVDRRRSRYRGIYDRGPSYQKAF